MRALGLSLTAARLAHRLDVTHGLVDGGFEIAEVDRLGQEIERPTIHRSTDIAHVAIGRNDNGRFLVLGLLQFLNKDKPSIRCMLMSETTMSTFGCASIEASASNPSWANTKV